MLSSQQDQDFKWVSASYVGPIWGQVRLPYAYVGAILGPTWAIWGCVEGYMGSFWAMLLRHSQKQPNDTPPKRPPPPLKAKQNQIKNRPKHKNSSKTLTWMAVKAKRNQKSTQNPPAERSPQFNLSRDWQNKGPP